MVKLFVMSTLYKHAYVVKRGDSLKEPWNFFCYTVVSIFIIISHNSRYKHEIQIEKHINIYHCCIFFKHFQLIKITLTKIFFSIKSIFLCIQHAKSSIKTILSKTFKQNVDYTKVDQFSTPTFVNDNVSRKIVTSSKNFQFK